MLGRMRWRVWSGTAAVLSIVATACGSPTTSIGSGPTTTRGGSTTVHETADQEACGTINGYFFYPTVPATGETVPVASAVRVEALLKKAGSPEMRAEAAPLQAAIDTNDGAQMVVIFDKLTRTICATLGVPPPT